MVCSGLWPRTCTNKVLRFCEGSISIDANHLKILLSALFLFFSSASQIKAFRWCNCNCIPRLSYRPYVSCGVPSSQKIKIKRAFAPARSEHVLTPRYSQHTADLLLSPSSWEQPSASSTDLKSNAYRKTMQRWVKIMQGPTGSFFLSSTVSVGDTVSHRGGGARVMLRHPCPFSLHGHDSAVGMPPGLIPLEPVAIWVTNLYRQLLLEISCSSQGRKSKPLEGNARSQGISWLLI